MLLYIFLLLYYILCMVFEKIINKKLGNKFWLVLLMLPMCLLTAFRAPSVGNDTFNYFNSYMTISQESFFSETVSRLEIGYVYLIRIFSLFGANYLVFQIVTTIFVYFSLGRFIYKYSNNYTLSIFCFMTLNMFAQTMNISRQFIAIAILTYSIDYILNKKLIRFSLIVVIATLFHKTSIIFFFIYFIANINLTKVKKAIILILGIIISVSFDFVIRFMSNFLGVYESYIYGRYFDMDGKIGVYILLLVYLCFFLLGISVKYGRKRDVNYINQNSKSKGKLDRKEVLFYSAIIITLAMGVIGLNTAIMPRLIAYFLVFFIVYIPDVLSLIKDKYLRFIVSNAVIVGLTLYLGTIMLLRPEWTGIIPYTWYFDW